MELRHQDREDPSSLGSAFLAGATAGTVCAILQTPVRPHTRSRTGGLDDASDADRGRQG
jgi:hypothetical protein